MLARIARIGNIRGHLVGHDDLIRVDGVDRYRGLAEISRIGQSRHLGLRCARQSGLGLRMRRNGGEKNGGRKHRRLETTERFFIGMSKLSLDIRYRTCPWDFQSLPPASTDTRGVWEEDRIVPFPIKLTFFLLRITLIATMNILRISCATFLLASALPVRASQPAASGTPNDWKAANGSIQLSVDKSTGVIDHLVDQVSHEDYCNQTLSRRHFRPGWQPRPDVHRRQPDRWTDPLR